MGATAKPSAGELTPLAELAAANLAGDLVAIAEKLEDAVEAATGALDRLDRVIVGLGGRQDG